MPRVQDSELELVIEDLVEEFTRRIEELRDGTTPDNREIKNLGIDPSKKHKTS